MIGWPNAPSDRIIAGGLQRTFGTTATSAKDGLIHLIGLVPRSTVFELHAELARLRDRVRVLLAIDRVLATMLRVFRVGLDGHRRHSKALPRPQSWPGSTMLGHRAAQDDPPPDHLAPARFPCVDSAWAAACAASSVCGGRHTGHNGCGSYVTSSHIERVGSSDAFLWKVLIGSCAVKSALRVVCRTFSPWETRALSSTSTECETDFGADASTRRPGGAPDCGLLLQAERRRQGIRCSLAPSPADTHPLPEIGQPI